MHDLADVDQPQSDRAQSANELKALDIVGGIQAISVDRAWRGRQDALRFVEAHSARSQAGLPGDLANGQLAMC
jgi:hypothetical protein